MYIPPEGPLNAKIAIVGEHPGREEELQGRPFVGSSGRMLDDMLLNCGIYRYACYITYVVKHRPPNGDFDATFYEDSKRNTPKPELLVAQESLRSELMKVKPNVIIALGEEALRALTGKRGLSKWRGSILSTPYGKVVSTFTPTYVMKVASERVVAELDLRRAREESTHETLSLPQPKFILRPSFHVACEHLKYLLAKKPKLAVDIETSGKLVRCIGLADSPLSAICIPFIAAPAVAPGNTIFVPGVGVPMTGSNSYWPEEQELVILQLLKEILSDPLIPKVVQNYPFDSAILQREMGLEIKGLLLDTMVAHHCLYPELPKGLDFLCSIYTRVPYYSDYDCSSDMSTWTYNCWDVVVTHEISTIVEQELKDCGSWLWYKSNQEPAMIALTRAQHRGTKTNEVMRGELRAKTEQEITEQSKALEVAVGRPINAKSPQQLQELLYTQLKLPVVKHRTTKAPTTNAEAIRSLRRKYPQHENIFSPLARITKARDYVSKFLNIPLDSRGLLVTSYNIAGTVNGRLSSSSNIFGEGTNLQNIPRGESRKLIIPREGYVLVKVDLSQAEVRVVAWEAPIPYLIERFQDPSFDIHRWNASNIFRIDESAVSKSQRNIAKAGVHGGNYGLGADKASVIYDLPKDDAQRAINAYRTALPEVAVWWRKIQTKLHECRTLTTPIGQRRMFFGTLDDELYRSAYSFVPQAVVSWIINRAFAFAEYVLGEAGYPLLQVHDEIVFEVLRNKLSEALPKIKNLMEYPIKFPSVDIPLTIPAEISFGPSWGEQRAWHLGDPV